MRQKRKNVIAVPLSLNGPDRSAVHAVTHPLRGRDVGLACHVPKVGECARRPPCFVRQGLSPLLAALLFLVARPSRPVEELLSLVGPGLLSMSAGWVSGVTLRFDCPVSLWSYMIYNA